MKRLFSLLMTGALSLTMLPAANAATWNVPTWYDSEIFQNFLEFNLGSDEDWIIDFQKLRSNPCFNAIGYERETCNEWFGTQSDFETILSDPSAREAFVQYALSQRCTAASVYDRADCIAENAAVLPALLEQIADQPWALTPLLEQQTETERALSADDDEQRMWLRMRANAVWDYCNQGGRDPNACYQEHIRLVTDPELTWEMIDEALPGYAIGHGDTSVSGWSEAELETARLNAAITGDFDEVWRLCADAPGGRMECYVRIIELSAGAEMDLQ